MTPTLLRACGCIDLALRVLIHGGPLHAFIMFPTCVCCCVGGRAVARVGPGPKRRKTGRVALWAWRPALCG